MGEINNSDITFVLQGPVCGMPGRPHDQNITCDSIASIRKYFPSSRIIVSTWVNQPTAHLDYDRLVVSEDPGPTVVGYGKTARNPKINNVNRQIVSTLNGLRRVETKYAVKVRSDIVFNSDVFKIFFEKYPARDSRYVISKKRIVGSSCYAREYYLGLPIAFHPSDFFFFGLLDDLILLWDVPLIEDYKFRRLYFGKSQSIGFPGDSLVPEQIIFLSFVNKIKSMSISHFLGGGRREQDFSKRVIVNNIVTIESEKLGLDVLDRFNKPDSMFDGCFNYSLSRWEELYKKFCDPDFFLYESKGGILKRWFIRFSYFIGFGLRVRYRYYLRKIKHFIRCAIVRSRFRRLFYSSSDLD